MAEESGIKTDVLTGAQAGATVIAAPGAGFAIRLFEAMVAPGTGTAYLHEQTSNTKVASGGPTSAAKNDYRKGDPPWRQLAENKALLITSTGDVVYSVSYAIVRTKNTAN